MPKDRKQWLNAICRIPLSRHHSSANLNNGHNEGEYSAERITSCTHPKAKSTATSEFLHIDRWMTIETELTLNTEFHRMGRASCVRVCACLHLALNILSTQMTSRMMLPALHSAEHTAISSFAHRQLLAVCVHLVLSVAHTQRHTIWSINFALSVRRARVSVHTCGCALSVLCWAVCCAVCAEWLYARKRVGAAIRIFLLKFSGMTALFDSIAHGSVW